MARSLSAILLHIIFSTKDRNPLLNDELIQDKLHSYVGGILRSKNCQPLAIGGMSDHIHIFADFCRDSSLAEVVKEVKRGSSLWIKTQSDAYFDFAWQGGYGAFSVSASQVNLVGAYIRNQKAHHEKTSFTDEFVAFLKKYRVEYDEKYLWD